MFATRVARTRSPAWRPSGTPSGPSLASTTERSGKATVTSWYVTPWRSNERSSTTTASCSPSTATGYAGYARIRSPFGSNSGSSATRPGIHSPKISTSTGVSTAASAAGRYAYAIERSTVYP